MGFNITNNIEVAFQIGLAPLIAEIINSNLLGIYYIQKKTFQDIHGSDSSSTTRCVQISNNIEVGIRVATVLASGVQFLITTSTPADHCANTMGLLKPES